MGCFAHTSITIFIHALSLSIFSSTTTFAASTVADTCFAASTFATQTSHALVLDLDLLTRRSTNHNPTRQKHDRYDPHMIHRSKSCIYKDSNDINFLNSNDINNVSPRTVQLPWINPDVVEIGTARFLGFRARWHDWGTTCLQAVLFRVYNVHI